MPILVLDATKTTPTDNIYIWDFKIRPLRTPYSTGFLQANNVIQVWAHNNNKSYEEVERTLTSVIHPYTDEVAIEIPSLENVVRDFLIPYNSTIIYNWLKRKDICKEGNIVDFLISKNFKDCSELQAFIKTGYKDCKTTACLQQEKTFSEVYVLAKLDTFDDIIPKITSWWQGLSLNAIPQAVSGGMTYWTNTLEPLIPTGTFDITVTEWDDYTLCPDLKGNFIGFVEVYGTQSLLCELIAAYGIACIMEISSVGIVAWCDNKGCLRITNMYDYNP
jgi:hypothetical protein